MTCIARIYCGDALRSVGDLCILRFLNNGQPLMLIVERDTIGLRHHQHADKNHEQAKARLQHMALHETNNDANIKLRLVEVNELLVLQRWHKCPRRFYERISTSRSLWPEPGDATGLTELSQPG